LAADPSPVVILMTVPVTVIGCSVAVVVCLLCFERVWENATGVISAPQARITIAFLIMMPPLLILTLRSLDSFLKLAVQHSLGRTGFT
jgi:hypothetical protein